MPDWNGFYFNYSAYSFSKGVSSFTGRASSSAVAQTCPLFLIKIRCNSHVLLPSCGMISN